MADRTEQIKTYVTPAEKKQLEDWADKTDKSQSALVREAILEYTDRDRTARIEEKLDRVLEQVDTLGDQPTHTHKDESACSTTPKGSNSTEKMRAMVDRIQVNHAPVVQDDDVERIIEDEAGADTRTLRKYKRLMRKRGLLFEHPGEPPIWTTQTDKWLDWVQDYGRLNGRDRLENVLNGYPASVSEGPNGPVIELAEVDSYD